ncbi:conserved hypothetical protein [Talaromyces stipitatus ATCC 10500]|uniref:Uncharacterized protein n=1 Tax=Talaromyces stipitatus (strain ATCC 10500 / CBS 375.48 / QM 6759 / NRRL 1006) TaxID=441959 RepID=B8LYF4_TALSN|nr:uncharacterized protein TSTA_063620 [Talaromyces stipitatus ATCC 10500]EED22883.1 conserved hypothetical protein [Talaromyces stipitatus ATCC 10500]
MAFFNSAPQSLSVGQTPSHGSENLRGSPSRGDASSHAIRQANEMRVRSVEHDAGMDSNLHELWQFTPTTRRDGGKRWDLARRKFIPSDQETLKDLAKTLEEEISVKEQYKSLTSNKQKLVNELVAEHNERDRRYRWSYVYINTETSRLNSYMGLSQEITTRMEVIILRELQHQATTAGQPLRASSVGHAGLQSSRSPNGLRGGQPTFDGLGGQANHQHNIGNGPGLPRAPENRALVNAGAPTMHSQTHPQAQSPNYIYQQAPVHPPMHPQTNAPVHLQGPRPAQSAPQQHGHLQVHPQMQNSMPQTTNHAMPQGARVPAPQEQGIKGQASNNHGQNIPQMANNVPPMVGATNPRAGTFARSGDETRHPAQQASAPVYTRNGHETQAQGARFAAADRPQRERKLNATAPPPRVIQQDRRRTHLQEDSSVMTEDESLFDDDGYSSSVSSTDSIAKGSLHREKRYMRRDMGDRGYRCHYRKQGQKSHSHAGYPSGRVDIFPSASSHRQPESRRHRHTSHPSERPVTVHESKSDFRAPGLAELSMSANEASYRLMKVEENQKLMIDSLARLALSSHKPESRDHVERGVALRGIEHDMPLGRLFVLIIPTHGTI